MISKQMKTVLLSTALFLFAAAAWARADKLAQPLAEALESSDGRAMHSMIVYLSDHVDLRALDDLLYAQNVNLAERHEVVIRELQRTAERSQGPVLAALDDLKDTGDIEGYTAFWIVNAVVVMGNSHAVDVMTERSDIDYVELNFSVEPILPIINPERNPLDSDANTPPIGIRIINAPRVWYELGVTGAGALVANCDTGVDGTHPALAARWRGNFAPAAQCWRAPISGSTNPTDTDQHGTHVMGTICGATNGGTGDTTGVAPGALWIGDDAIGGGTGATFDNNVLDAYQWMADPDGNPGTTEDVPDVCQNSWGIDSRFSGYTDCDNRWNTAIIALETAGCVVTFSAGNEGPGASTHRSPANVAIDSVTFFAIGAVDASTADTIPPLPMASFSSRGPSDCNGQIKPEVSAPGVNVYSSIPGGGYSSAFSGTSMAGPHVAGIVGLMRSANPNVDVRTIKSILMRTARDQDAAGNDNTSGFGLVDAYAAVLQVMQGFGRISGTVLDANTLLPVQAQVSIVGGGQGATADGSGNYSLVVPGDSTYTVRYSRSGYTTQDIVLTVAANDTVVQNVNLVPEPIISGTVRDANTLLPIPAQVSVVGGSQSTTANGAGQYSIIVPPNATYTVRYSLYGYTTQDFVLTVGATGTIIQDVDLVPRPVVILLNEDFEDGAPDWSHSGQAGWVDQWHVSTERAHAGSSSYKCGDTGAGTYVNHVDAYLVSPVIASLPAEARFYFWHQVQAETSGTWADSAYDGGILEISANGGAFTQVTPTPAYNKQIRWRTSGNRPYNGPLPGVRCYTGNMTNWVNALYDMAAYEGQNVQFRFRFMTDSTGVREGWYVDDVLLTAFGPDVLSPVTDLVIGVVGTDLVLSWTSTGAPLYNIYSDTVADGAFSTLVDQTSATAYTIVNGFASNSALYFVVRSTDGALVGPSPQRGVSVR